MAWPARTDEPRALLALGGAGTGHPSRAGSAAAQAEAREGKHAAPVRVSGSI
jgi:hypothetical protein